ncbi:hypothetical protein BGZ65_004028, partial [Modicella reniformis]
MPKSLVSKITHCARHHPILLKPSSDSKKSNQELTWEQKAALLKKYDEWCKDVIALGVKPSIRRFEDLYAKRNQVLRLLKQRPKLEGLKEVMPDEVAGHRIRVVTRPFLPIEKLIRDWLLYFRRRLIPINVKVLRLLGQDVYR